MIYLYSDYISRSGGIETYLYSLATHLHRSTDLDFRVAVAEMESCPLVDDLVEQGVDVYRQPRIPGDRWRLRQRMLMQRLQWKLEPDDWVFCVRQPMPSLYLNLVRKVHRQKAKIAASWMFAPRFLVPDPPSYDSFCKAVEETDAVVSVSECTVDQYQAAYGYDGPVEVVRYHNLPVFDEPIALPEGPPWKIGFMGRLDIEQKNLDTILHAFRRLRRDGVNAELHFHGGGQEEELVARSEELGVDAAVTVHGAYDHRTDLRDIVANGHVFLYTSRYEGGPCFTLLELLQAGRYVVASPVGGIPDIYEGHPEAGLLVDPDSPDAIAATIKKALEKIQEGRVNPSVIRKRYLDEFDMQSAHTAWMRALNLNGASA